MRRVFIIAEAGVNHNGDLAIAKRMVDVAAGAGADAVKFQTFKAERLVSKNAPKAEYQRSVTSESESQLEMLSKVELDAGFHKELISYCKVRGIKFLSTPFDLESIELLNELGLDTLKIPSGEIVNLPYLRKIGSLGKRLIMSTGMANMNEAQQAVDILVRAGTPGSDIVVLQCNTEYPTRVEDANLMAMCTMREVLSIDVGYSDHTPGIEVAIAAAALGASVIEKHFTLDRKMDGPDHKASLEPEELMSMVKAIRNVEKALGEGIKEPSNSELKNKAIARKSIVASKDIKKGECFSGENITTKRPGAGISPMEWDNVLGKEAKRDFKDDELIEL